MMLMLTESTLFFLNLTSKFRTNPKFSLIKCVDGWISDVSPDATELSKTSSASKTHTTTSALSLAHGPPSSALSSSCATSVLSVTTKSSKFQAPPALANASDAPKALVGGFDDESDDSQEHLDAFIQKMKGKQSSLRVCTRCFVINSNSNAQSQLYRLPQMQCLRMRCVQQRT